MARKKQPALTDAMEAVARSLQDFGYRDATAAMCREIYDAWKAGKRFPDLPHGIIGGFAEEQFREHADMLAKLKD